MQAIKRHRELTGMGLKEAKEHVDNLRWIEEMKALKSESIDEMREKISRVYIFNESQKEFVLDLIDEAFYLGEDSGHMTGYAKSMEENVSRSENEEMEQIEEEAYSNGWEDGRGEGYREGYDSAREELDEETYDEGWRDGRQQGIEEGKEQGYSEGYEDGKHEGYDQGWESAMSERGD